MPDHLSHGRPYVQPERHDELSDGVAAAAQNEARAERTGRGQWVKGARTAQTVPGGGTTRFTATTQNCGTPGGEEQSVALAQNTLHTGPIPGRQSYPHTVRVPPSGRWRLVHAPPSPVQSWQAVPLAPQATS
jgi:hypothetical protein